MGGFLVVDTSVLVAMERGAVSPDALHGLQPGARPVVSSITVSELLHGCHRARPQSRQRARERFVTALLAELEVVPFDLTVAREHARIWADLAGRGEVIGPYDLIMAATALACHAPLATLNEREFCKIKGLQVCVLRAFPKGKT